MVWNDIYQQKSLLNLRSLKQKNMKLIYNELFLQHQTDGLHPESCQRLQAFEGVVQTSLPDGTPYISLVHTPAYIQKVKDACKMGANLDGDTMTSLNSFKVAVHAIGATMLAAAQNGFALVRPPGHHAHPNKASGFCLFNNIAIATQHLVNQGKRVLIIDFDGHCGDGTQAIFKESAQVLFWSVHQHPAFPYTGSIEEIGEGEGKGYTINVPIPPRSGDDIFMDAFEQLLPNFLKFKPDIVAVSAGFDAHLYDLLLDLRVTVNSYYRIGQLLAKHFKKVFAALEGGYNVALLPQCVYAFLAGMNGLAIPYKEEKTSSGWAQWEAYDFSKHILFNNLRPYWK